LVGGEEDSTFDVGFEIFGGHHYSRGLDVLGAALIASVIVAGIVASIIWIAAA